MGTDVVDGVEQDRREITAGAVIAAMPDWVDLSAYEIPARPNPHFIAGGVCALLDDAQIDLCAGERAWFHRRADLVTAPAGAERVAHFSASFDPAFERLEIHSVKVIREGEAIDWTHAEFQILRREQSLERLIFDGRVTLHMTLPDVRPGDVIETAMTTYGMRKSLQNKHTAWLVFDWSTGIVDLRVRQRTPKARVVAERAFGTPPEPTIATDGDIVDKRWRAVERRAIKFENLAPAWIVQPASMQFSEWKDWQEVATAFAPLYREDGLPEEFEREAASIAAKEPTSEGRIAAILRFIQGGIRYLAISMGEGGYTPRSLSDIAATRYGDCKDKAKLFVALAKQLGIEACPVLVDTRSGYALDGFLPSAQVFDHCIVRVTLNDKDYWLDGTRSPQASPLANLHQCHMGWALPLKENATLARMPDPTPAHTLETREKITLGSSPEDPVRYEWRHTSRRGRADWVREHLVREGAVGLFNQYANDVQRAYPLAEPARQDVESDDVDQNEITLLEVYNIPGAWTHVEKNTYQFATLDLTMKSQLAPLDTGSPRHPIYLGQVGKVSREVEINSANTLRFNDIHKSIQASSLSYEFSFRKSGPRTAILQQTLEFKALTLPPQEADKYRAIIAELDKSDIFLPDIVNRKGQFVGAAQEGRTTWVDWTFRLLPLAAIAGYWVYAYLSGR